MSERKSIGFVGIGNMGWPMAANLVRAGHSVVAYDLNPDRAAQFASKFGATAATSLDDMSGCEMVVTMLPTGKEVREAVHEADNGGLAAHLKPGSIVIDMSSAEPGFR